RHTTFSRDWSSDVCSTDLIQANAVPHRLHAAGDRRAAAVDVKRDAVLIAVLHDGDDLLAGARGEHGIRQVLNDLVSQAQGVDHEIGRAASRKESTPWRLES